MDAGLAAVLGAVVGAIGTGGAGIAAALLARSQSRLQLQVEVAQAMREPRKAIFVAYAEGCRQEHEELQNALSHVQEIAAPEATTDEQQTSIDEVERHLTASINKSADRAHVQAQVEIEGPEQVIDAAIKLSVRLNAFHNAVIQAFWGIARRDARSNERLDEALTKEAEATVAYRLFLCAASDSLTIAGLDSSAD
jgi:hypothetical protein